MKQIWADDWRIAFDGRDQTLTGRDRYRGTRIEVQMQYSEGKRMGGTGELGWRRARLTIVGKDGVRYVLGKNG